MDSGASLLRTVGPLYSGQWGLFIKDSGTSLLRTVGPLYCGQWDLFIVDSGTSLLWTVGPLYYGQWDLFIMDSGTSLLRTVEPLYYGQWNLFIMDNGTSLLWTVGPLYYGQWNLSIIGEIIVTWCPQYRGFLCMESPERFHCPLYQRGITSPSFCMTSDLSSLWIIRVLSGVVIVLKRNRLLASDSIVRNCNLIPLSYTFFSEI